MALAVHGGFSQAQRGLALLFARQQGKHVEKSQQTKRRRTEWELQSFF
ncbi:MAG: hypothetical protein HDT14_07675 [Oscillibacter sp.]|nr:hypothetical protein [Oscillibacter sp.]